jgi:hypothetical protein
LCKKSDLMKKELFQIDYELKNGAAGLLWKLISTPSGLSEWFAENVEQENNVLSFQWGETIQKANIVSINPSSSIRFHWEDEPAEYYFEFKIDHSELTRDVVLSIIDFADASEKKGSIELWNSQIDALTRRSGM